MRRGRSVDLTVAAGEVLCVVGESGSGKSVSMLAVMGLLPSHRDQVTGEASWRSATQRSAGRFRPGQRRRLIGRDVAMVFQEPTSSLNPCYPDRLADRRGVARCTPCRAARANRRARVLESAGPGGHSCAGTAHAGVPASIVGRAEPASHDRHGHRLCNPALLIADEPTTALDVTVQKGVLDLLVGPAAGPRHGAGADHARHGRGGGDGAARAGDVLPAR